MIGDGHTLRLDEDLRRGKKIMIEVNGSPVYAFSGETVAAALCAAGRLTLNHSPKQGEPRGMYCGMGVCYSCRMTINGVPNILACQTTVEEGMQVKIQKGHGTWGE
jgi:sarcosine oxidase subunit alpha